MSLRRSDVGKKFILILLISAVVFLSWGPLSPDLAEAAFAPITTKVTGWINPDQPLNNVYVVCHYDYYNNERNNWVHYVGDSIPAGQNTDFSFNITDWGYENIDFYVVLGLYDVDNNGVTVGMDMDTAAYLLTNGKLWDDVYGTPNSTGSPGFLELEVAEYLKTHDADGIKNFSGTFAGYYYYDQPDFTGDFFFGLLMMGLNTTTLVDFSGAAFGGEAYAEAEVVPIPGAVWLLGSGLLGLATIRRRFGAL